MCLHNFSLEPVIDSDLPVWIDSKKACYRVYVDRYYGGWNDEMQVSLNTEAFGKSRSMSFFRKIVLDGSTVGFCGYDEQSDRIAGVTIHMYEKARNQGIGSYFLEQLTEYSRSRGKPVYLKVFRTNPARRLYERFGFSTYGETDSHYLMLFQL